MSFDVAFVMFFVFIGALAFYDLKIKKGGPPQGKD
jgi:hypothetical protein